MRSSTRLSNSVGPPLAVLAAAWLIAAPAVADPIPSGERETAKRHAEEAAAHYYAGRFAEALASYQAAHDAEPVPALLFNIAQCHKHLGDHERAIFFFSSYLRNVPDAANRDVALALLEESERALEEERQLRAHRAAVAAAQARERAALRELRARRATEPAAERRDPSLLGRWWFWTAVGGAAAIATGAIVYSVSGDSGPDPSTGIIDWK